MSRPKRLNDRQLALLRRICHGPDPITSADSALAVTVYALRNRGLVTTPRTNGHWTARPTAAGTQYLAQQDNPPTRPTPKNTRAGSSTASPTDEAQDLLTRLQTAGGVLHIPDPPDAERARIRRALHAAKTRHLIPEGHRLQHTGRNTGDLIIKLLPGPHPTQTAPRPQPLPVDLDLPTEDLHPAVRDATVQVCPDCQHRARRLLHALAHAAQRKGHTPRPARDTDACLEITVYDSTFPLHFIEGTSEHLDPDSVQYSWQRVTTRVTRPSHKLDLLLPSPPWGHRGGRYRWGDRQRWCLEDKLHQVLDEIEQRARADHNQRLEQQRKKEETRRRWEQVMEQARLELFHDRRIKALREQAEAWHEANRIRAYCDALDRHVTTAAADTQHEQQPVTEWSAWARRYADDIDPLLDHPGPPQEDNNDPEELRPYLQGWSPHGPERK
ncbi:hypothetical protein [Streptomyces ochraceiscleroticus]|uniref:PE-PGRS family protein n=1 Tax=Streptomyces ochraceiscleroticus TaxID=47761 RepID=A0ABW1MM95_9ACTN|nr:hypothetical protein [Streptomyces ochraceiscleroticus]